MAGIKKYAKRDVVDGLAAVRRQHRARLKGSGRDCFANGKCFDPYPTYNRAPNETIIGQGHHNAIIVAGQDRPAGKMTGYGGRGDTHAGRLHMIVGRMGHLAASVVTNSPPEKIIADPDFKSDAATLYMSQKTDVDENFRLSGPSGRNAKTRSAIALKADCLRFVSREDTNIHCGVDEVSSQGNKINTRSYGINLIANNDAEGLEPLVKGHCLVSALQSITDRLDKLSAVLDNFMMTQLVFNTTVALHTHNSPFLGIPVGFSPSLAAGIAANVTDLLVRVKTPLLFQKVNLVTYRLDNLTPLGKNWILSKFNKTN